MKRKQGAGISLAQCCTKSTLTDWPSPLLVLQVGSVTMQHLEVYIIQLHGIHKIKEVVFSYPTMHNK